MADDARDDRTFTEPMILLSSLVRFAGSVLLATATGAGFTLLVSCGESPKTPEPATPEPDAISQVGGVYAQVCAACHGVNGEGKEELHSPSITGLPTWYLEEQVKKFRSGARGFHP